MDTIPFTDFEKVASQVLQETKKKMGLLDPFDFTHDQYLTESKY